MKRHIATALAALLAFSATASAKAYTGAPEEIPDSTRLRIVQYNVGAFRKSAKSSPRLVARMLREAGADIVSINEIDSCNIRSLGANHLRRLCKAMGGWSGHFGNALSFGGGGYGVALCWSPRLNAIDEYTLCLEKGNGAETRAAAVVEFEDFVVVSTHLDYLDPMTNLVQAMTLSEHLKAMYGRAGKPVLLCGDLNARPDGRGIIYLRQDWELLSPEEATFPSWAPEKCIDYIFLHDPANVCECTGAKVLDHFSAGKVAKASDHLPVSADINISDTTEIE